jgi:hypothetical protein
MASPVILKPMALAKGGVAGLILVLNAHRPERISVNNQAYRLMPPAPDEPVLKALKTSDVLDAVLKAAESEFQNRFTAFRIGGEA